MPDTLCPTQLIWQRGSSPNDRQMALNLHCSFPVLPKTCQVGSGFCLLSFGDQGPGSLLCGADLSGMTVLRHLWTVCISWLPPCLAVSVHRGGMEKDMSVGALVCRAGVRGGLYQSRPPEALNVIHIFKGPQWCCTLGRSEEKGPFSNFFTEALKPLV